MLERILYFLALDGASFAFQLLSHVTFKSESLKSISKKMQRPLVLRVRFENSAADRQDGKHFLIPFRKASVAQLEIYWGDGSSKEVVCETGLGYVSHRFEAPGDYTVRIFPHGPGVDGGWLDHLGWDSNTDSASFLPFEQWWRPLRSLESLGSLGIKSLEALFYSATEFNQPLANLDTSSIVDMKYMFCYAKLFNQPIGNWNVSNVTDMRNLFFNAVMFNQSIGKWNVSKVSRMDASFYYATNFNHPIGEWDTSNVVDMCYMFYCAKSFNQDISRWNVSKVTNMSHMFAWSLSFRQDISNWDISNVCDAENMFWNAESFDQSSVVHWKVCDGSYERSSVAFT